MIDELLVASVAGLVLAALAALALVVLHVRESRRYIGRHQAMRDTSCNPSCRRRP